MENPIQVDDLEVPLFQEAPIWSNRRHVRPLGDVTLAEQAMPAEGRAEELPSELVKEDEERHQG